MCRRKFKHPGEVLLQRGCKNISCSGKNTDILKKFCVNTDQKKIPLGCFVVVVLKLKIVMKQLLLVSWVLCFHSKILLLRLEGFLFCFYFFTILNNFLNKNLYSNKETQAFKYVTITTVTYWASGSTSSLELKFLQLGIGTSACRQTLKSREKV